MKQFLDTERRIFYRGDLLTVTLELDAAETRSGFAFLRTNIGMANVRRRDFVARSEAGVRPSGWDWRDLAMCAVCATSESAGQPRQFRIVLPLLDCGTFEAKAFFRCEDGRDTILWPEGENFKIKVEAAENCSGNIMYTAFVRQFGENCGRKSSDRKMDTPLLELDRENYVAIPPSGTFRNLKEKLDFLFDELGIRILQLLPIHPVPTVFGRMGRFGSPFAALDYFAVDPALADFDRKTTPMDQFCELCDAVHAKGGRLFLDIPVNHTGWGSQLQLAHPDYFVRETDGTFESPGAWGVVWADLCRLDYRKKAVYEFMAQVFLFWCRNGVDGFRCDAGYMLPVEAWEYIESKVRCEYPETVFMLEGLGGPLDKQERLLQNCSLDWAYSELFQNYDRSSVEHYLSYAVRCSREIGTLIHFAETHDNNRLASVSLRYSKVRCALTAFTASAGAFGFTNGVEWGAVEKIDVHGASALNWGSKENLVDFLRKLHALLREHPAFEAESVLSWENWHPTANALAFHRISEDGAAELWGLLNFDCERESEVLFRAHARGSQTEHAEWLDLMANGERVTSEFLHDGFVRLRLAPGEFRILSCNEHDMELLPRVGSVFRPPQRVHHQQLKAQVMELYRYAVRKNCCGALLFGGEADLLASDFYQDWKHCFRKLVGAKFAPVSIFDTACDERRIILLMPHHFLAMVGEVPFHAELKWHEETLREGGSVRLANGKHILLFEPLEPRVDTPSWNGRNGTALDLTLRLALSRNEGSMERKCGTIRCLPEALAPEVQMAFSVGELLQGPPRNALCVNEFGGIAQVPAAWGTLVSKYDALLCANFDRRFPVDKRVMLTRCRAWVVLDDFSQELQLEVMEKFKHTLQNSARWEFVVPIGKGQRIRLDLTLRMAHNTDAVELLFMRRGASGHDRAMLADTTPVKLILRCDIDDRINHEVTKAYLGAERHFPESVHNFPDGFDFTPNAERTMKVRLSAGHFVREDEWHYMTGLPLESYYGLEDHTDLYSPGYFECNLAGRAHTVLRATAWNPAAMPEAAEPVFPEVRDFAEAMAIGDVAEQALRMFLVRRDAYSTVMAGYPWFLDWGRDTLIVLRGVVASGNFETAKEIILQFASFEQNGTIPNMIRGDNDANRDTSDAPLWLIVATQEYVDASGDQELLSKRCGKSNRTLLEALSSIAEHYLEGTPNGIAADGETLLIYSPPHFTWMDTNYPAASPREGYPIEIQALWYAALHFLAQYEKRFVGMAERVQQSIVQLFYRKKERRLSDCLHCNAHVSAMRAVADDAIRPNQLLAITLGVIEDPDMQRNILRSCDCLLVPGGIRSLADAPVHPDLPVWLNGHLLNDPAHPYQGEYRGAEDTSRKVAYHNGTAWGWPFPSYAEAMIKVGGKGCANTALSLLISAKAAFEDGVPGQLPEVMEGNAPHHWGGCSAQAWSVSEFYRVWKLVSEL